MVKRLKTSAGGNIGSDESSSSGGRVSSRFLTVVIVVVFLAALTVKFDKNMHLSSYVDYFESNARISQSGNFSLEDELLEQQQKQQQEEEDPTVLVTSDDSTSLVWSHESIRDKTFTISPSTYILVDQETGHIITTNDDGKAKLVVNVNESYLFWMNGQDRLCQLLRNMTLSSQIDGTQEVPPALLNVTMDCVDHATNKQGLGQGNWLTALYDARMAVAVAGVDFQFQCTDGRDSKMSMILPWFDQYIPAPSNRNEWPYSGIRPSEGDACSSKYPRLRIDKMAIQIQQDIRKMAVQLLGKQDDIRQHPDLSPDAPPLIPNVELDDVAIHFRCGDVLGGAKRNDFGMIRFYEYKKWIPRDTPSIGILTQPFEKDRNRGKDAGKAKNCQKVVETLVDYLQAFAPNARISIHNGPNETLPLAYGRLAMANYSFTSLSSFGIFPVVGTFGQGYFQRGNRGVNPFATHIPKYLDNVHQMTAEVRGTWDMFGKSIEDLIAWFIDESNAPKEILEPVKTLEVKNDESVPDKEAPATIIGEPLLAWSTETHQLVQEQPALFNESTKFQVDEEIGYIQDGRLVVNVNETYLFWFDGAAKLCRLLKNMTLTSGSLGGNQPVPLALVNATMDCIDHAKNKEGLGQGNWVTAIYSARMTAALAGVDFKFQCSNGQESKMKLLLPWFDQYVPADSQNRTVWPYSGSRPNEKEACPPKYPFLRIDKVASQIQDDIRRMAVALLGTRDEIRKHRDVAVDTTPLIPDVELDDVAIHFRCGDVMGGANRYDFGMIGWQEYKKLVPSNTTSIGILTQPFDKSMNRKTDAGKAEKCRDVVFALVEYLQPFAPDARIRIHNDVNETLPLAYARLAMANYSITSLSSFGIFPVIGTFGQGYFQKGNRGVNPFATYIPNYLANVHQMEANVQPTGRMRGKSVEELIDWFVNN